MKTIFSVLMGMLLVFTTQAQVKTTQPVTNESVRQALATNMANFVASVKPFYKKGQTQASFSQQLLGTWKPTPEGAALLNKAFVLIQQNANSKTIINTYNGKEMAAAVLVIRSATNIAAKSDGAELFGGKTGVNDNAAAKTQDGQPCKWYQLWCHLQNFADWFVDNWQTIKDIIIVIFQ